MFRRGAFNTSPIRPTTRPPCLGYLLVCWRVWRSLLLRWRARLRAWLAVSPKHQAETSSSSYGLVTHQRLLSTPPHGDAVTVGYRQENVCLDRSRTCQTVCARTRTSHGRKPVVSGQGQSPQPPLGRRHKSRHRKCLSPPCGGSHSGAGHATTGCRPWLHAVALRARNRRSAFRRAATCARSPWCRAAPKGANPMTSSDSV